MTEKNEIFSIAYVIGSILAVLPLIAIYFFNVKDYFQFYEQGEFTLPIITKIAFNICFNFVRHGIFIIFIILACLIAFNLLMDRIRWILLVLVIVGSCIFSGFTFYGIKFRFIMISEELQDLYWIMYVDDTRSNELFEVYEDILKKVKQEPVKYIELSTGRKENYVFLHMIGDTGDKSLIPKLENFVAADNGEPSILKEACYLSISRLGGKTNWDTFGALLNCETEDLLLFFRDDVRKLYLYKENLGIVLLLWGDETDMLKKYTYLSSEEIKKAQKNVPKWWEKNKNKENLFRDSSSLQMFFRLRDDNDLPLWNIDKKNFSLFQQWLKEKIDGQK